VTIDKIEFLDVEPPAAQAKVNHSPATNGSYVVDSYNGAGGDYTMHPVSDGGMVNVGHSIRIIATPADGFVVSQVKVNETILEFVYDSYAYIISDETELTVYVTFVEAPEPPATSYVAEIHTNNVGNAIYTWEANKKTVNCSAVPASMTQWANGLFDAPTKAYNTIRITLTGTEGLSVGIKVDTQTPNNNMYDSKPGNKQYKKFGTDPIVIEWSLTALEMDALKIQKVVLWFYDASGTVTTASVTIDKIEFLDVEPPAAQAKVNHSPATNGSYVVDSFNGAGGDYTMHPVSDGGMVNVGHYIRIIPTPADGFVVSQVKVNETILEFVYDSYAYIISDETELTIYVIFEAETPEPNPNEIEITGNSQGGSDFTFSADFMTVTVKAATGSQWGRFNFSRITRLANHAKVTISGGDGLKLMVKLDSNDPNNTYDNKVGNKQTKNLATGETVFEWDLEALGMDAGIFDKLVFWVYNNGSSTGEFTLVSLELYYFNPNDIEITGTSQGGSTFAFSEDFKTVTVKAVGDQWGRFNFARITRPANRARVTILGGEGLTLLLKLDSNNPNNTYDSKPGNKTSKGLTGGVTVYEWDLEALGMDASILDKLVFWAYNNGSSTGEFRLVSLELYYEEPPVAPYVAEIHTNNVGNAIYTWEPNKKTVNCSAVPASMTQWANGLFDAPTKAYNTIRITLTGTEGLSVGIKVDTQTPNNNMYDSKPGNKQYKKFGTDPIVIEWSLTALEMDALKIQKVVLWFYDASGTVTTASVTIESIEFLNV
ncbi:MAG TPA: hypothetical protein PLP84_00895, partial [Acholeplasmataceae bacterium]|nr:hypothetical protein [Acholeplasmataceae bacterium]